VTEKHRFGKEDIGGEILSILTTGLYADPFDALREYVQNAIDARAKRVSIEIDPSTILVEDDGDGMDRAVARRAIRLGISDKNATQNIGFRGIGIYSAFNLCDRLEIFTRPRTASSGSKITFDFQSMRRQLLMETERRKKGLAPQLYLEALLETSVSVTDDTESGLEAHGTRVILSGLLPLSHGRVMDWDAVVTYLQNVVPLPFSPHFSHGALLTAEFKKEDHRVVPIDLRIGDRNEPIYRPYTDALFTSPTRYPPHIIQLPHFGFAWICINGRRVIKDNKLRGLLLKKFGFSIGNRSYLESYFKRTVLSRRITGEIILQHPDLLPNAARSDFEPNAARQDFLQKLPVFIATIATWADTIQQDEKGREVLAEVLEAIVDITTNLPTARRERDALLQYNVEVADLERRLKPHERKLAQLSEAKQDLAKVKKLLATCKALVRSGLSNNANSRKNLERDIAKAVQAEEASKALRGNRPKVEFRDISSVLDAAGIRVSRDLQRALRALDELLAAQLEPRTYAALLHQYADALEDSF